MIPPNDPWTAPPDDGALLDLLVEDELDHEARRALLLRLDAQPDGWRRLALAFLEAQSWRAALNPVARDLAAPANRAAIRPTPPARPLRPWLARAATVALVFSLGWAAGRNRATHGPVPGPPIASPSPPAPRDPESPATPVQLVTHEPVESFEPASSRIPDEPQIVPTADFPDTLIDRLHRQGYEVERRPAVAAVLLHDGRRLAVPVEDVKLRYVGGQTY